MENSENTNNVVEGEVEQQEVQVDAADEGVERVIFWKTILTDPNSLWRKPLNLKISEMSPSSSKNSKKYE